MPVPQLELVSFDLCPYVQRAAIALVEKGVPFKRTNVDLANKPDWFHAISPLGKVPLLRVGDAVLFESAVIVEYLEDTCALALHPADPLERARHRAWIEFSSSILADIWGLYSAPDAAGFDAKVATLRGKFERLEAELAKRNNSGPYFTGASFCLVDAAFAPVFRYWDAFDTIADFGVLTALPQIEAWRTALAERPSVRSAVIAAFADNLMDFLRRRESHLSQRMQSAAAAA